MQLCTSVGGDRTGGVVVEEGTYGPQQRGEEEGRNGVGGRTKLNVECRWIDRVGAPGEENEWIEKRGRNGW